jgi:hypothetical protein
MRVFGRTLRKLVLGWWCVIAKVRLSSRSLRNAASAEATEEEACMEGIRLTAEWIRQLTYVETDCVSLI